MFGVSFQRAGTWANGVVAPSNGGYVRRAKREKDTRYRSFGELVSTRIKKKRTRKREGTRRKKDGRRKREKVEREQVRSLGELSKKESLSLTEMRDDATRRSEFLFSEYSFELSSHACVRK